MVKSYPKIYSYKEAQKEAKQFSLDKSCASTTRLLLGNGFSRSYFGDFGYTTLFEAIKDEKKNQRIKKIFEKYGNSNFEGVLKLLQDSSWLLEIYKIPDDEIKKD